MARRSKIIEIEGLGEVTIKEVSPFAAYSALTAENKLEKVMALVENCISLDRQKIQKLYPSEIDQITKAFIEVNKSFLAIADRFGIKNTITKTVATISKEMSKNFQPLFAASFKTAMEEELGTMDGATS